MFNFQENFPLSKVTTLQIGGPAKQFVIVSNTEDLIKIVGQAYQNHIQYLIIGGGSNLLVADERLDKLVIKNEIEGITKIVNKLKVKSGLSLQNLIDYSIGNNLSGLQKLSGIPGTVGGAIFGNAGAYGQTISDNILEVICLNPESLEQVTLQKEECEFDYRNSIFKKNSFIILEIVFKLTLGNIKELRKEAEEIIQKRLIKYPKGIKCPGSFFKNLIAEKLPEKILSKIPKDKIVFGKVPAGSLLELVGAQGQTLGEIEIASYHANLFINKGDGKASDFYTLAKKYALKVKERFGITLEPEVQLINLPPII